MAIKSMQVPSLDWLNSQFRIERRKALIWSVLFLVIGIIIGGVLGYSDVFDNEFFSKLEPGVWVAIVALITSFVFAIQNWRHNKLTVRPNLDITRDTGSQPAHISIMSSGLGPAVVKKIEVRIDGKLFELSTLKGMVAFFESYGDILSAYQAIEEGVYLVPGESKFILKFSPVDEMTVGAFIGKLSFSLTWQSIYGENFSIKMKNVHELQQVGQA